MVTDEWRNAAREREATFNAQNAMSGGTLRAGGYVVPTLLSSEIIELARNKTQVLAAGARVFPMANRKVDVAKWAGNPTPAWHSGERADHGVGRDDRQDHAHRDDAAVSTRLCGVASVPGPSCSAAL
jgi:HK97 family phage major capsid protein